MDANSSVGGVGGGNAGIGGAAAANKAQAAAAVGRYAGTAGPRGREVSAPIQRAGDQVDFSTVSRAAAPFLEKLKKGPPIREAVVAQVRKEIAEGSYDTPEKMEEALDGLIEHATEKDPF